MNKSNISKSYPLSALVAALVVTGCASQSQILDSKQDTAIQAALARGRFDLNCPTATGTVLSRDFIQPALAGPYVGGVNRAEYTIGVAGCEKRATYIVVCQEGTETCVAAAPDTGYRTQ